jgi:Tfp pilus assembly protein PilN
MRAVNLLPEKHRPRRATGGQSGSSYVLIGVLGAIVVAVLVYVLTTNSINTAKTDIAEAKAEATRANAQADALGAYGDFAKIKQQREDSVKQLAQQRVDWERAVRELAHVLPGGVWIRSAEASATGDADAAPSAAEPVLGSPTITLVGCAVNQNQVADTLVRLRQLQGASDVKLDHSSQPEASSASSGSTGSAGSSGTCGTTGGTANYEFQAEVTLTVEPGSSSGNVPARLGGGQ